VEAHPVAERCPNCGAPLELVEGKCRWCSVPVHLQPGEPEAGPPAAAASGGGPLWLDRSLVPDDVDDQSLDAFVHLMLSTLRYSLGGSQVVQDYLDQHPGMRELVRALSVAVGAAGVRARDEGPLPGGIRGYTPDEIWAWDLALDLIAMAAGLPGLPGGTRASIADDLRLLEEQRGHMWKHRVKEAGDGPEALRPLRALVPPSKR
jgi:hypothetical protein